MKKKLVSLLRVFFTITLTSMAVVADVVLVDHHQPAVHRRLQLLKDSNNHDTNYAGELNISEQGEVRGWAVRKVRELPGAHPGDPPILEVVPVKVDITVITNNGEHVSVKQGVGLDPATKEYRRDINEAYNFSDRQIFCGFHYNFRLPSRALLFNGKESGVHVTVSGTSIELDNSPVATLLGQKPIVGFTPPPSRSPTPPNSQPSPTGICRPVSPPRYQVQQQ